MLWKNSICASLFAAAASVTCPSVAAFVVLPVQHQRTINRLQQPVVYSSPSPIDADDEDEEDIEPGKMRVAEIKAELDMRGVQYDDCFDKESLVTRLQYARSTGKADPSILTDFNKRKLEENISGKKLEINDEDIDKAVANDGTLPGGMDPESLKKLLDNPEVMNLLQSTKMQDAMKIIMTGDPKDLEKAMADDKEMLEVITELNKVLGTGQ